MPADSPERPALHAARAALADHHRHVQILVRRLPGLFAAAETGAPWARELADRLDEALRAHMRHEEEHLFPAILGAAESPARHAQAFEVVSLLLVQHREMIVAWQALREGLGATGPGGPAPEAGEALRRFAALCEQHMERGDRDVADLLGLLDEACLRRLEEGQPARRPPIPPSVP